MNKKGIPLIDRSLCMSCGMCIQACPFSCLECCREGQDKLKKPIPSLVAAERCTGCGLCAAACPVDCIVIRPQAPAVPG